MRIHKQLRNVENYPFFNYVIFKLFYLSVKVLIKCHFKRRFNWICLNLQNGFEQFKKGILFQQNWVSYPSGVKWEVKGINLIKSEKLIEKLFLILEYFWQEKKKRNYDVFYLSTSTKRTRYFITPIKINI